MQPHQPRFILILSGVVISFALYVGAAIGQPAQTQATAQQPATPAAIQTPTDDLQRSIQIDSYRVGDKSGAGRGEVLYFYKCWMCHNKYTIAANPATAAPYLATLFKRKTLLNGDPLDDDGVAGYIKNGGARMPSFGTTMKDSDISDLVSYLKSGKCCLEGENPPENPWYRASTNKWSVPTKVSGGPKGVVRTASGELLEGMMLQLIAPNSVRTTVYSDEEGKYEFPAMQTGEYTLRVAKPLEFKPYRRDVVRIDGANALDDIVLESLPRPETPILVGESGLPATPEIFSQLSGAEQLWNLTGTSQEKETLHRACGSGCHDFQRIFRNRYDERSWRLIVDRMMHHSARSLIERTPGQTTRGSNEQEEMLVKWLVRVRGPESVLPPLQVFPRPKRGATRLVVTEYELPHLLLSPHDVDGDAQGNVWFTSHKTNIVGMLDPRTGIVKEYRIPVTPGFLPGTHSVKVDSKHQVAWFSWRWTEPAYLTKLDLRTEQITQLPLDEGVGLSNFGLARDGSVWTTGKREVLKLDPLETGNAKAVKRWPLEKEPNSYDNLNSMDGNFWAGGGPAAGGHAIKLLDTRTGKLLTVETSRASSAAKGGFDPEGNPWFGGRGGTLITLNAKAGKIREYWPPLPYTPLTQFYEAMPDKNGEVWAGVLHGRGFLRLNPKGEKWTEYVLPEPYANNYRTWIDNSTNPISVWYVDYMGYLVRIQPLE